MVSSWAEGVCPHCIRLIRLTPKRSLIAVHKSYTWLLIHEDDVTKFQDYIAAQARRCPGTWHKPLRGAPPIDDDPPAYCEI